MSTDERGENDGREEEALLLRSRGVTTVGTKLRSLRWLATSLMEGTAGPLLHQRAVGDTLMSAVTLMAKVKKKKIYLFDILLIAPPDGAERPSTTSTALALTQTSPSVQTLPGLRSEKTR